LGLGSAFAFRGIKSPFQTHGFENYKRTIADMILSDGTNVNYSLVKDGACWWYRICYGDTVLEGLENEAREAKKDLWVELSVVGVAEPYKPQVVRSIRIAGSIHSLLDPEHSNRILKTSAAGDGPLSIGT
jgi:endonuclease YncB( thermonuclease family)